MASTVQIDKHRTDRGNIRAAAPLLTAEDVAAITGLSTETLAQWRSQRKGIPFLKLSRNVVRYQQGDLDAWLAQHIVRVESGPSNAMRRIQP
jgi:predicted DNA-binding transcriptional regulator AlpA